METIPCRRKEKAPELLVQKNGLETSTSFQNKQKLKNLKKTAPKKREISLYSPEYLAKKHGIKINDNKIVKISKNEKGRVSFGFYNSLIIFVFINCFITYFIFFTRFYSFKYTSV